MPISKIMLSPKGPSFSRLALGVWRIGDYDLCDPDTLIRFIEAAFEMGYSTFDHADIYGDYANEEIFGRALKRKPSLRDRMEIVTKCGIKRMSSKRPEHTIKSYDTSARHIRASIDNSLNLLNTDYIDLFLIHRPSPLMNPDEIAATFADLKKQGKVRFFGVSNFTPAHYTMLQSRCDFPLVTNQIEVSLLHLEPFINGNLDHCIERKIAPMAWSPFGGGALFDMSNPKTQRIHAVLNELKARYRCEAIDQIAIAWLLKHPANMLPIIGSLRPEVLKSVAAAESIVMSDQEWFELYSASTGVEVP
jgi:predicted oxidoreductase